MYYDYPHFIDKDTKRLTPSPYVTQLVYGQPGIHTQANQTHSPAPGPSSILLCKRSMMKQISSQK